MVNITQDGEDLLGYNPLKEYPLFGHKDIVIDNIEYTIKKCYVKNNKIYLKLLNKKTRLIKEFNVVEISSNLYTQKNHKFITLYNSIKNVVNKYINKIHRK